jgi:signal-transduction protein with cAMP-binding, CBS, and nucleotidyltransferase domain
MKAIDAIRKPAATIAAERTIVEAAQRMDAEAVGALVVTDGQRPVGIVTDRDLMVRGLARRLPLDARVDTVMSTDLVTMDAAADLRDAFGIFRAHALRRLPLTSDGHMVGMLTVDDLVIDLVADLVDLARPLTGQVIFGHPETGVPVPTA